MTERHPAEPPETRAEIARRRLAQLTASFEEATGARSIDDDVANGEWSGHEGAEAQERASSSARGARRPGGGHRAETSRLPQLRPRVPQLGSLHVRALMTLAVAAGVFLTWWVLAERPRTADLEAPVRLSAEAPGAGEEDTATGAENSEPSSIEPPSDEVVVDVAGRVKDPGIVTLPAGSRVYEAIRSAGGLSGRIEEPLLNMARPLVDGEQILVGVEAAEPATVSPAAPGDDAAGEAPIDLNSATAADLETLPGVGPVTAQSILDWRAENGRFASVDDLLSVSGIGEKTLEDLRDRVRV